MKLYVFIVFSFLLIGCKNKPGEKAERYVVITENFAKQTTPQEQSIARGKKIYTQFCLQCHLSKGEGIPGIFPPLAGSNWLSEKRRASIHAVKYGLNGEIKVNGKTYNNVMLRIGLNDQEVADVLNYVMTSWGNTQKTPVTKKEVSKIER